MTMTIVAVFVEAEVYVADVNKSIVTSCSSICRNGGSSSRVVGKL